MWDGVAFVVLSIALSVSASSIRNSYTQHLPEDISYDAISSRIVGGQEALDEQFPYQAGILLFSQNGSVWCGGTLIGRRWVATCAHCLHLRDKGFVYLGTHRLLGTNEVGTQTLEVTSDDFIIHPEYDQPLITNDIGLIRLPVDARISRDIKIISLPASSSINEDLVGVTAVASGWGYFSDSANTLSGVLRYVDLIVVSNEECIAAFGSHRVDMRNLCTTGMDLKSPCSGDSGGPLVIEKEKKQELIGLVSYGSSLGCEKKRPAVFVRVSYYLGWIKLTTGL